MAAGDNIFKSDMSIKQKVHDTADRIGTGVEQAKMTSEAKQEEYREKRVEGRDLDPMNERAIMREVQMIGGALVTILIIALVLNEVYAAVDIGEGPFSSVVDDLETTGVAALSLLIVGLIIVAASAIMRVFGGGGFGNGGR